MKRLIKLDIPIIVEGKYDKITLENVVDALIIPTDGFGIFKNKEKCDLIRKLAEPKGIIVMTDSDSAGGVIRSYLKKIIDDLPIINVYVPELKGKERRKAKPSKEGTLGVEGMTPEIIEKALKKSGVFEHTTEAKLKITKNDLFVLGFSGGDGAKQKRKSLLKFLELPESLSPSAMLDVINNMFTLEELKKRVEEWQKATDKS